MIFAFFFLPFLCVSISDEYILIICICVPVFIGLVIIIIVLLYYRCKQKQREKAENFENNRSETTASLIPPVFFTEGMSDPLKQDDLIDGH